MKSNAPTLASTTIMQTPEEIRYMRCLTLRGALKLEVLGMKRHGRSAYSIVKDEFNFKGSKVKVLAQLERHIKVLQGAL